LSPLPVARRLVELVPHLSTHGMLSRGGTRNGHGNEASRASKWPGGLNPGISARGILNPEK
jgi:hypothetical protein